MSITKQIHIHGGNAESVDVLTSKGLGWLTVQVSAGEQVTIFLSADDLRTIAAKCVTTADRMQDSDTVTTV